MEGSIVIVINMNFIVTSKRMKAYCKQKYISLIMQVSVKEKMLRILLKKFLMGSLKVGWGPRRIFGFFLIFFRLLLLKRLLSAQYVQIMWRNATHLNKHTWPVRFHISTKFSSFFRFVLLSCFWTTWHKCSWASDTVCRRGRKNQSIARISFTSWYSAHL